MSSDAPAAKKLPLFKLALVAGVIVVGAVLVLRGLDLRAWVDRGMLAVREAGPWIFFAAMTLLPSAGFPLMFFTIPAGEAFAGQMTLPGVIAAVLVSLALNLALTYWMARYAFRPLLMRVAKRYGYEVPKVTKANALTVTLLVRLTPGPPYSLQGYLLGLAEVPFGTFMMVSWLCTLPWAVGAVVMGQGILNGNFKIAVIGTGVIVAAIAVVHFVRKKLGKRES
ncbi:MAG: hypothetical protein JWM32_144 [Verrucomicrobia bacterium]|nr:hypothetical protein [Verrucomicrobiota bacterium]